MIRVSTAKLVALVSLMVVLLTALAPTLSLASVQGRKNTAIGLGAAAVYSLSKGHTGTGLLLGAGAAYSYKRAQDERHHRHHKKHLVRYYSSKDHRYHRVWR